MIPMQLKDIARELDAELMGSDLTVDNAFTDSRICEKSLSDNSALFVALTGLNFDGHQFLPKAVEMGAVAAIVERKQPLSISQLIVKNSRLALAKISRLNRRKSSAKYVAITGSSGKTTVKEMIASILSLSGKVYATQGNFNNDIGVPLTLLAIDESIEYGVIELGASHLGEIAFTADLVCPDVALVNNVAAAHLQGFGDLQGVATAKSEIYASLPDNGVAVVNSDDEFSEFFIKNISSDKLQFSVSSHHEITQAESSRSASELVASQIKVLSNHSIEFQLTVKRENVPSQSILIALPLIGLHNVSNALAAASCCFALDIPLQQIVKGLALTPTIIGRLMVKQLSNGCRVIDDSYNANPSSMMAAIEVLEQYPEPRILVIGDMGELGGSGREMHEKIGCYAQNSEVSQLFSCGELTRFSHLAFNHAIENQNQKSNHFSQQSDLIEQLREQAKAGTTILVKGSRKAKMERVVDALIEFSSEPLMPVTPQMKLHDTLGYLKPDKISIREEH